MSDEKNAFASAPPPSYPGPAGSGPAQTYAASPGPQAPGASGYVSPSVAPGAPQQGFAGSPSGGQPQFQQYPYPQQQPSVYSPQPQFQQQPMMMGGGQIQNLGTYPTTCYCPSCGQSRVTRVEYRAGGFAHVWALVLGVTVLCCCIPYCVKDLKDVHHYCSNCGTALAVWHRSGRLETLVHQVPQQQGMPLQPQQTGMVSPPAQYGPPPSQFSGPPPKS